MPGGLIQLITTGVQDSAIIGNPEITFFKTVYKQHTQFASCQNERFIGSLGFNKESSKVIEHNGDLLYNLYLKFEIPYFQILKQNTINNNITTYNINTLSVTYQNNYCLLFYINNIGWYLIPQYLFSLSKFNQYISNINSISIENYVLPDYIKYSNYGQFIKYYEIADNSISSIINTLRINSNFWEQYWLDYISTTNNEILSNPIQTLKTIYNSIYLLLKDKMFNLFYQYEFTNKNISYFNLEFNLINNSTDNYGNIIKKTETERYFEYKNSIDIALENPDKFDIDIVYNYCINNYLNFNDYIDQIFSTTSLCILLILDTLYSNNNYIFTFYKKYKVIKFNEIDVNTIIDDTNVLTNWQVILNNKLSIIFNTTQITNIILREFKIAYNILEQSINSYFKNLNLIDPQLLYVKLKTIMDRYTYIPNNQINFNDGYYASYSTDINSYKLDNYAYCSDITQSNYSILNTINLSTNDILNLRPVNIINIFSVISNEIAGYDIFKTGETKGIMSFFILWRNVVNIRLYNNFLDTQSQSSQVNIHDYNLALYYSIDPSNLYYYSDFIESYNDMFFKNSWIGSYSIMNNDFLQFKDNLFTVSLNTFNTDFSTLIKNNNFYELNIVNTYNFIYYENIELYDNYNKIIFKKVIYDNNEKILYLKYDNIYNSNTKIQIKINNISVIPDNISQQNMNNEFNSTSLYLVLTNITNCPNFSIINIIVTYSNYIPILYFDNISNSNLINYPSSVSNILYLYKTTNSSYNYNLNYIDIDYYNNYIKNNICLLTISYFNSIVKPPNNFILTNTQSVNSSVTTGEHIYCISFFSDLLESDVSDYVIINCNINNIVQISNIPISNNLDVIGRKIYRSYANQTKLYLLTTINNNSDTIYVDNISDGKLGINYNIINNINYNYIPTISSNITKVLINLKETDISNQYYFYDLSGNLFNLPTDLTNVEYIYIESINFPYNIINNFNYLINNIGQITYNNISRDKLYYLINTNNYLDSCKLIVSKEIITFIFPFSLSIQVTTTINTLDVCYYFYAISLFDSRTNSETIISDTIKISCNNNEFVNITINQPFINNYNTYCIYRTKIQNSDNSDKTLYLLKKILRNTYTDERNNGSNNNPPQILLTVNNYTFGQNNNLYNNFYNYIITNVNNNIESRPSNLYGSYLYNNTNNNTVELNITGITIRKLYRTKANIPDTYYLLTTIAANIDKYIDNTTDSNLGPVYISINDNILQASPQIPRQSFNYTYPFLLTNLLSDYINTLDIGYYFYAISYYNSSLLTESSISDTRVINCNCDNYVQIDIKQNFRNSTYDSYRIYRSKIQNSESTDSNLYLLTTLSNSVLQYIDIRHDLNPSFNYLRPASLTVTETITTSNLIGSYRYIITFCIGTTIESLPSEKYLAITYVLPNTYSINLTIPINSLVTSRKIYRTLNNNFSKYYLLDNINNKSNTYIDYISDSELINNSIYNNIYNNDLILSDLISNNYLNITSSINNNLINKMNVSTVNISIIPNNIINDNIFGTYYYKFTYFNNNESNPSDGFTVNIIEYSTVNIQIKYINQPTVNIYRTNKDDINNFLFLKQVSFPSNSTLDTIITYVDDLTIIPTIPDEYNYALRYSSQNIIRPDISNISYAVINQITVINYINKYKFSFYNTITCEESLLSDEFIVLSSYNIITDDLYIDIFFNRCIINSNYKINIYRSEILDYSTNNYVDNTQPYYLISSIPYNQNLFKDNSNYSIDNLNSKYYCNLTNYYLMEISINNLTPNLDKFNSHSTDIEFINIKGNSDFNDFLFNKPFIMLTNNSSNSIFSNSFDLIISFTNPLLYFYNINFKIDQSSVITLNKKPVIYILPVSTQQFFIKDPNEIYYRVINNNLINATTSIQQLTFNPAFDEFNVPINYLLNNKYYSSSYKDELLNIPNFIINLRPDYPTITNLIEQINDLYVNSLIKIINPSNLYYGNMSKFIITSIDNINKLFNVFNKCITLPILEYTNNDYFNYSHDVLRYVEDTITLSKNTYNLSNINPVYKDNIKILSPVYNKYSSNNKVSSNLYNYLKDVVTFYNNQITYIDNNVDYLNLTNPNSYSEQYITNDETIQTINDNLYITSGSNLINLLYPIIDDNIDKILINNVSITDFNNISNNSFNTDEYLEYKIKNKIYDSKNINVNKNSYSELKFNYYGILSIDDNNNIIVNDTFSSNNGDTRYIISEDNNIYNITFDYSQNKYKINNNNNNNIIISNPIEIINLNNGIQLEIDFTTFISTSSYQDELITYLYEYDVIFESDPLFDDNIVILINNLTFVCSIYKKDNNQYIIQIITNIQLMIETITLLYHSSFSNNWINSPEIININTLRKQYIKYAVVNNIDNNILNTDFIYGSNGSNEKLYTKSNFYSFNNKSIIFNNYVNKSLVITEITNIIGFIHLDNDIETSNNIYLYSKNIDYTTNILQSITVIDNYIYSYISYNQNILNLTNIPTLNYILLIDLNNNIRYMIQYYQLNQLIIPQGNYHTYVYSNSFLNLINYNLLLNIDTNGNIININKSYNLPCYSYYLVNIDNRSAIYYYEIGNTMYANGSSNYFIFKNITITNIYLIDNNLFNSLSSHLINYNNNINVFDDLFSYKILSDDVITFNKLTPIYFKSKYTNQVYNIINYNNDALNYVNNKSLSINLLLSDTNITAYYPLYILSTNISNQNYITDNNNIKKNVFVFDISATNVSDNYIIIGVINIIDDYNYNFISTNKSIYIVNVGSGYQIRLLIRFDISLQLNEPFDILDNNFNLYKLISWEIISINVSTNQESYYLYFWTIFGDSKNTVNNGLNTYTSTDLLNLRNFYNNIGEIMNIQQPCYKTINDSINISSVYTLISSIPNIVKQVNDTLYFTINNYEYSISRNYYIHMRNTNIDDYTYSIQPLNFKSIDNIKPNIQILINNNFNIDNIQMNVNAVYYILSYLSISSNSQVIIPYYSNELSSIINNTDISNLSISYSIDYPNYVSFINFFTLVKIDNILYNITNISKLYLEINEIICIEGMYFLVNGLSVFNNLYELTLIRNIVTDKNIRNEYYGYYTLGVYTPKNNNIIPSFNYQNLLKMHKGKKIGDITLYNNTLTISTFIIYDDTNNYLKFDESPLSFVLYYKYDSELEEFYLFDNFIKLKVLDKLIYYNSNGEYKIYEILSIVDNRIYFNLPIIINNISLNNTFITFILPYQPFENISVIFDNNGKIIEPRLNNYQNIVINDIDEIINIYPIVDNIINLDTSLISGKPYLVRLWKTNYYSNFQYVMKVPNINLKITNTINIDYSIELDTKYLNGLFNLSFFNNNQNITSSTYNFLNFYYFQPVKINGTYNYIKNVTTSIDNDIIFITLLNDMTLIDGNVYSIILSSTTNNEYNYYFNQKFNYNFAIQVNNYNLLDQKFINVIRYIIQDENLILIQTTTGTKNIMFEYGISIEQNEYNNNITTPLGCTSLYFYNSFLIKNDGTISNFDMSIGSYHLITLYNYDDNNKYNYLARIIYPNKLYFYTSPFTSSFTNYYFQIDKFINIKIDYFYNFTYSNTNIIESRNLITDNNDIVKIIKKYEISSIGIPVYINNKYYQQISFINGIINTTLYNNIYTDSTFINNYNIEFTNITVNTLTNETYSTSPNFYSLTGSIKQSAYIETYNDYTTYTYFYIISNKIINNICVIYTINKNYLVSTVINKVNDPNKKLNDTELINIINNQTYNEFLVQELSLSKLNKQSYIYKYNIQYGLTLFLNQTNYYINTTEYNIVGVDNIEGKIIFTENFIDNDVLELSNEFTDIKLFIKNILNSDEIINFNNLFVDIKQLKNILVDNSKIEDIYIYYYIKPWKYWSLLSSIIYVKKINTLVFQGYLQYNNLQIIKNNSTLYSYLTNDEVTLLSSFLTSINKSEIVLNNYIMMIQYIQPILINNLNVWLNNADFFLNVSKNINIFLSNIIVNGNNINVYFDGNNIIFNNDPTPDMILIDGNYEISSYITNEFQYEIDNNIVYRSTTAYDEINLQIYNWINKITNHNNIFGINIHKLLRYLKLLGDDFINLINNFSNILENSPEYLFNNPLKFLVNKTWENNYNINNNLQKLNNNYSDILEYSITFENLNNKIVSNIEYFQNLSIIYIGLNSLNNYYGYTNLNIEYNLTNLTLYYPLLLLPIATTVKLKTNSLFPYLINLKSREFIQNSTYSILFLNGLNIGSDINVTNINGVYSNQITFYLDYDIKPDDFFIVKQLTKYLINNINFHGYLYDLTFNNIIYKLINSIIFNNINLNIISFNENSFIVSSLEQIENINNYLNIEYQLIYNVGIKDIKLTSDGKQELYFYSKKFNYIDGSTLLKNDNQIFILYKTNNIYYITGKTLINKNIYIVNILNTSSLVILNQVIYEYSLDPSFDDTSYTQINNNLSTLEFKLVNPTTTLSISPIKINSLGDNKILFYYSLSDNININYNYNMIYHNKHLNENLNNIITNIKTFPEYLYYFNFILPKTSTTIIYLYDNNDDISNYEINNINKISILFYQTNNQSYFTISNLYNNHDLNDIRFIQKNSWTILSYTYTSTTITFTVPSDFILNTSSNYEYKINDYIVDKTTFIFINGMMTITFMYSINSSFIFKQFYIESSYNTLIIPDLNQKIMITFSYPNQYTLADKYYIIPYTNTGEEYDQYLYLIKTNILSNKNGFYGIINKNPIKLINLYNIEYDGYVVMEYYDSTNLYYLISLKKVIDTFIVYKYQFENYNLLPVIEITTFQNSLEFGNFFYQDNINTIYLFMRSVINNYSIENIINCSNFYLVSYNDYDVINLYNPNIFVQNNEMISTTTSTTSTDSIIEEVIFNDFSKLLKSYSLYFNDQLIEEINEDIININKYLYFNDNTRQQIDKMTQYRFNGVNWELYMPLFFWFCNKPGLVIPSVALPHTDIILKYKFNDIAKVLSNDLTGKYNLTIIPQIRIKLITDFILLDSIERTLFGTYSHEYIINRYKIYPNIFINSQSINSHKYFTGLVKDIYLISKPLNSNLTYYAQEIPDYDYKYDVYIKALAYYKLFIINNLYTSTDQLNYATDIEIIINNTAELNIYYNTGIGDRIVILLDNFDSNLINYLMYYEDKYLSKLTSQQQINFLSIYIKYQFSDKVNIKEISPLQSLTIRVNGSDILAARDNMYYNNVIPYSKFKNSIPTGYYTYSFSLNPLDDQPSGHLNFTNFDDVTFIIKSDPRTETNPYTLETIVKEYNILRIMSGIGSLAWIS